MLAEPTVKRLAELIVIAALNIILYYLSLYHLISTEWVEHPPQMHETCILPLYEVDMYTILLVTRVYKPFGF